MTRPQFICPTWAGIVPLLVDGIERPGQHGDRANAARAELLRLAQAMDAWNERAPRLRQRITAALERLEDAEPGMVRVLLRDALNTLETDL